MKMRIYQNLWNTANTVLRRKCIALNDCNRKESSQINNLSFILKKLRVNSTQSKKEIWKAEINKIKYRKAIEKIVETKSLFFEKINS